MKECHDNECPYFKEFGECSSVCERNGYARILTEVNNKQSSFVSEIFAELDSLMLDGEIGGKYPVKVINPDKYAELKNKYIKNLRTMTPEERERHLNGNW